MSSYYKAKYYSRRHVDAVIMEILDSGQTARSSSATVSSFDGPFTFHAQDLTHVKATALSVLWGQNTAVAKLDFFNRASLLIDATTKLNQHIMPSQSFHGEALELIFALISYIPANRHQLAIGELRSLYKQLEEAFYSVSEQLKRYDETGVCSPHIIALNLQLLRIMPSDSHVYESLLRNLEGIIGEHTKASIAAISFKFSETEMQRGYIPAISYLQFLSSCSSDHQDAPELVFTQAYQHIATAIRRSSPQICLEVNISFAMGLAVNHSLCQEAWLQVSSIHRHYVARGEYAQAEATLSKVVEAVSNQRGHITGTPEKQKQITDFLNREMAFSEMQKAALATVNKRISTATSLYCLTPATLSGGRQLTSMGTPTFK